MGYENTSQNDQKTSQNNQKNVNSNKVLEKILNFNLRSLSVRNLEYTEIRY